MINLKLTVISAVLGLIFSLLIGMISQVTFGYLIIRALISAVLTGGIAAAASFVFKKFLADDAVTMSVAQNTSSTGNIVDITLKVDEDVLPDADNAPPFMVSPEALRAQKPVDVYRKAAMQKTNEPVPSAEVPDVIPEPAHESENEKAGFIPQPLVSEKTPQFSIVPDVNSIKAEPQEQNDETITEPSGGSKGVEGLDELPDLTDVVADVNDEVSDVISDSDFATTQNPTASYTSGNGNQEVNVGNDAELMANTIRTLLKSEG